MMIGSLYLVTALVFTLANLPCLYVMVSEKNLWKNSCIKVGRERTGVGTRIAQMMVNMGVLDQINLTCHMFFAICTMTRQVNNLPYW
jgi:hypothetical protein